MEIYHYTGAHATNLKVAARLARKIHSAISFGQTVLVDYDRVLSVDPAFALMLLPVIDATKVKVAGLPPRDTA